MKNNPTIMHWDIFENLSASYHFSKKTSLIVQSTTDKNFTVQSNI